MQPLCRENPLGETVLGSTAPCWLGACGETPLGLIPTSVIWGDHVPELGKVS
jgi:hypothetical protein